MSRALILVALGRRAGRRGGAGSAVHRWALVAAAATALFTCWIFLAINAVAVERTERIAAREPVFVVSGMESSATARWILHSDYDDNKQFDVFYVAPLRPDAPPPPGLPRWPAPGEVFLSPALLDSSDPQALQQRYGRYGGTIARHGLTSPAERLAYYRPPTDLAFDQREGRVAISGFGIDPERMVGDLSPSTVFVSGSSWTATDVAVLVLVVVSIPAAVLVLLAVRSNAERRDRRLAMLDALGASPRSRAWVLIGEAVTPVVVGALLGGLTVLLATLVDLRLPLTEYIIAGDDLASTRALLAPLALIVATGILALVVIVQLRSSARGQTRPRKLQTRLRGLPQTIFPLALGAAIWGAANSDGGISPGFPVGLVVFLVGMAATFATLPSVLASLAVTGGRWIAVLGGRRGWPSAVVGGRWLGARPALVARLCAAFVIGLGLLVQVQVQVQQEWVVERTRGLANGASSSALSVGDKLVSVRTKATAAGADQFAEALGRDRVLRVVETADQPVVVGTCTALQALGRLAQCPQSPVRIEDAYSSASARGRALLFDTEISDPEFAVTAAPVTTGEITGFFVLNDASKIGEQQIQQAAYATLTKPYVSTPGQDWIAGGLEGAATFSWVLAFGLMGVAVLVLAGALAAVSIFLSQASSLGVLAAYNADRRLYIGIAGWNLALPLVIAGIIGATVAGFLGWLGLVIRSAGELSMNLLVAGIVAVVALATLLALVGGEAASRAARSWRPSDD
ncbi:FtsX-like permease family protein [Micromonospora sp. DT228]|uniref:FtsX-like permease family protein n=1 Tax=Micromonospora sp. DT228 TaxID=3393443 RepID=UPI003CF2BBFA